MENGRIEEKDLRALISSLQLPPVILEIYDENIKDPQVAEYFEETYFKPESILTLSAEEQKIYQTDRFVPLLEIDNSLIIAYDTERKGYIDYYLESDPMDSPLYTWDGVFLEQVTLWFEDEMEEDEILHLGKTLHLKHVPEILESLMEAEEDGELDTFEGKDQWMTTELKKWKMVLAEKTQ
ncbi:hypothetical protein ACS126_12320 [Sphingobacterium lactis]|uniref:hypothetical protein n=1 Tax=Sphingobacterium lactis TaxID=797291 RepID=UPI003EC7F001